MARSYGVDKQSMLLALAGVERLKMDRIEYRVRPVTRWIVTRYEKAGENASVSQHGEYDNFDTAYEVGYALCKVEHGRIGWTVGDDRIQYPRRDAEAQDSTPEIAPR